MKVITVGALALFTVGLQARADFSYTTTSKNTRGALGGGAANQTTKYYFKGQKMKVDNGDISTLMDFDAETITVVNNRQKTATVRKFSDLGAGQTQSGAQVQIDAKETGEKKVVNGYNARELVMTMDMEMPQGRAAGVKMQIEMDMWLSPDVPGVQELRDFYRRNADRFPWAAMARGANPQMQAAMANVQRKIASMDGVTVLQVAKVKSAGGIGMPQTTSAQNDQRWRSRRWDEWVEPAAEARVR